MDKKKRNKIINIIFNIVESTVVFLLGLTFKVKPNYILIVMLVFLITKIYFGKSLHYKCWYKCVICSLAIMLSLFTVLKVDLVVSIMFAIFSAFIMTGRGNIEDMYLWSGRNSKYQALKDVVAVSPNNPIILEHEEYWRKNYPIRYDIFKLFFREGRTYQDIADEKDFYDNTITKRECATIYSILEKPLSLPPISKNLNEE